MYYFTSVNFYTFTFNIMTSKIIFYILISHLKCSSNFYTYKQLCDFSFVLHIK